ncbi:MAG: MBL fold metallo-hydrolase [Candidatus Lokiarchaeota archaeon]|nr:MBL fold metallo-hydrolase [Candidatus Lokiarchaeota archaeon]
MIKTPIIVKSGKINDYLHHLDLLEYGLEGFLSCFVAEFEEGVVILDCGSSLCVPNLLKYLEQCQISLSSVRYFVTTHHHYDHVGGLWFLYEKVKKFNPDVKIITNQKTKELLLDYEYPLQRARRNFGDYVGEMKPIDVNAFQIVNPCSEFDDLALSKQSEIQFTSNGLKIRLSLLSTPGHTPDHQCPLFLNENDEIEFLYLGEAGGTLYHSSRLISMSTSMAIYYQHEKYMSSLEKLIHLRVLKAGLGHFGVIDGERHVIDFLNDNYSFMQDFQNRIIKYYRENPSTKYVVERLLPFLATRTDRMEQDSSILRNITLGTTYGMMMNLGYRNK